MATNEATLLIRIKQLGADALDKVGEGLEFIADKAKYVATAIAGMGALAINSFKDAERASNELSQSMVNQGVYTIDLKNKYDEMASALQKTTVFADEQITSAQATLQAFVGQREVTEELVKATMDLAQAKGMDLKSAAELVGKTIGTETNALARQGVVIDETATKNERMTAVIGALNAKFAGQAEAAAKGLGTLDQLKNVADDLAESIGKSLAPVVSVVTGQLIQMVSAITNSKETMNVTGNAARVVAQTFMYLGSVIVDTIAKASGYIGVFAEAISELAEGNMKRAYDAVVNGSKAIEEDQIARKQAFIDRWNEIENAQAANDQMKREQELANIQHSEDAKVAIKKRSTDLIFTEEQKHQAKLLGLELKTKDDLKKLDDAKLAAKRDTLSTMATLQDSNNKALAAGSRAFAAYEIAVATPQAISKAMAAYPPPFNFAAAGLVAAAMAKQAGALAGVKLAEGGIVKATPGGVPAIIGEGGRDEAVIPLDDPSTQDRLGGGKGTTIIFNGPVLGDEAQAMEFARAIDRSLLKLRQSNQSVAFETDIF